MNKHTERIGVVVVGGGAAGLVAAIMAARNGAKVLILEHNEVPGKKILATGNGKCNYTNKVQGVDKYYGQNPAFVAPVFEQFGLEETLQFFKELGISLLLPFYSYPRRIRLMRLISAAFSSNSASVISPVVNPVSPSIPALTYVTSPNAFAMVSLSEEVRTKKLLRLSL